MCLICEQVFSNEGMKPSKMIDHLKSRHSNKADRDAQFFINLTLVPPTKSQKNFEKYFCVSFVKCLVNYP